MRPPVVTPRTRFIFAAAIVFMIAQSLFIHFVSEPYPAIMMPGFSGSSGYRDGRVELNSFDAVFVSGEEEFSFPPSVLLNEFPDSKYSMIANTSLMPPQESPPVATGWLRRIKDAIFPAYGAASGQSPEAVASLQNWLRGRARVLVPGRAVSRVEIRWYRETVTVDQGRLETTRKPTHTFTIQLDGAPQ